LESFMLSPKIALRPFLMMRGQRIVEDSQWQNGKALKHLPGLARLAVAFVLLCGAGNLSAKPRAIESRPDARPFLNMPADEKGKMPVLLSQTGAFADTAGLVPSASLVPYELNVAFWSDGAEKQRWISVPSTAQKSDQIHFTGNDEWLFPPGTVFVKHFELPADTRKNKTTRRRLETRLIVCTSGNNVYGVTYKWRADGLDADLLTTNLSEDITVKTTSGTKTQTWYYPSRLDCKVCHTTLAGGVLGVKTRQLNRLMQNPSGAHENQLLAWSHAGLIDAQLTEKDVAHMATLVRYDDPVASVESRARSWLDANCTHCHRPGGTVAFFDTRYSTPLLEQKLINGQVLIDQGIDGARIVAPADIWRSLLFMRANALDSVKMPPLAHNLRDEQGMLLLKTWIEEMPGSQVVPPPTFFPAGGSFTKSVEITITDLEPGAVIHFTTDGSAPSKSDPVYEKPIKLSEPATLRAKAYKSGMTRSITAQQTFIVE
jgi:uncharacterized repeat protein (TIGR03806 family)